MRAGRRVARLGVLVYMTRIGQRFMNEPWQLSDWLKFLQAQHPTEIELGLERVRVVWERLGAPSVALQTIIVAGTNGKGSTVGFIDALARAHGWRVGRYTSPHLQRFNERVVVQGTEVSDARLIAAFARVRAAQAETRLTYFEFTTLAALVIFAESALDLAVLEVGLGGRLDAVNLIDADVAVLTSVDLDHQDWLGHTREAIGFEKAGVFRRGKPAIVGFADVPDSVRQHAAQIGARLFVRGDSDRLAVQEKTWSLQSDVLSWQELPKPLMLAPVQVQNAASALLGLARLPRPLALSRDQCAAVFRQVQTRGRLQTCAIQGRDVVFDVGHNPEAARALAAWLAVEQKRAPEALTFAVFSVLADKDIAGIAEALSESIDLWFVCGLDQFSPRGRSAEALASALRRALGMGPTAQIVREHESPAAALQAALQTASDQDRILVFGSFVLLEQLLPD